MPFFRQKPEMFEKFEKAMADGKLDLQWHLDDVTVTGGVLRGTLVVETEMDVTIRNAIELDLGAMWKQFLSAKP